jgi:3-dehydroquinate synthase
MSRQTVHVALGPRSYDIVVGSNNLADLGPFTLGLGPTTHAVVITDRNVVAHANVAVQSLQATGARVDPLTIEPGEGSKSVAQANELWNELARIKADRKTVIVAVGGGVIGDLAGFIAATYTRGLRFVQVPTTLLAQVDSSVGGKVGVNLPSAKNMVGAFWQPQGVLIDTAVLDTLPDREYRSGLAEVVKYGVILDAEFFEYLEANVDALNRRDPAVLRFVVARCCRLKADVVEQDEREETGLRAVLNYGHTFAHALETVTSYGILLHGEAVSIGMMCAVRLAAELGKISGELAARQQALLNALHLPVEVPNVERQAVLEAMGRDKKVEHGKLRFVLPTRLGHVELVGDVTPAQAWAAMHPAMRSTA